jgi:hypothetical protein
MKDLTGLKINKLTVIRFSHRNERGNQFWIVKCECGNEKTMQRGNFATGRNVSCGCYHKEKMTTHNLSKTKFYKRWFSLIQRCEYKSSPNYKNYGARGIKVCEEWRNSFISFYNWAVNNGYQPGLDCDRINNDGDYSPENCRWVTRSENNRNRRPFTSKHKRNISEGHKRYHLKKISSTHLNDLYEHTEGMDYES